MAWLSLSIWRLPFCVKLGRWIRWFLRYKMIWFLQKWMEAEETMTSRRGEDARKRGRPLCSLPGYSIARCSRGSRLSSSSSTLCADCWKATFTSAKKGVRAEWRPGSVTHPNSPSPPLPQPAHLLRQNTVTCSCFCLTSKCSFSACW